LKLAFRGQDFLYYVWRAHRDRNRTLRPAV
jgi:hypothetical protein